MAILGLCKAEDVVGGAVVRQEKAYPVYDDDYAANVESMRAELEERYPTLHMVGRNGMHRYNNQDHSMLTAKEAANQIVSGKIDKERIWSINVGDDYHEVVTE